MFFFLFQVSFLCGRLRGRLSYSSQESRGGKSNRIHLIPVMKSAAVANLLPRGRYLSAQPNLPDRWAKNTGPTLPTEQQQPRGPLCRRRLSPGLIYKMRKFSLLLFWLCSGRSSKSRSQHLVRVREITTATIIDRFGVPDGFIKYEGGINNKKQLRVWNLDFRLFSLRVIDLIGRL